MEKSKILSGLIYIKTGLYITNKNDCKKLSQLISDKKLGYLSESTLYRYFLHPNSTTKPYKNTLHILAKFCDFDSWNHFEYYCNTNQLHNDVSFLTNTLNTIISEFVLSENFDGLIALFKSIENEPKFIASVSFLNKLSFFFETLKTFIYLCPIKMK